MEYELEKKYHKTIKAVCFCLAFTTATYFSADRISTRTEYRLPKRLESRNSLVVGSDTNTSKPSNYNRWEVNISQPAMANVGLLTYNSIDDSVSTILDKNRHINNNYNDKCESSYKEHIEEEKKNNRTNYHVEGSNENAGSMTQPRMDAFEQFSLTIKARRVSFESQKIKYYVERILSNEWRKKTLKEALERGSKYDDYASIASAISGLPKSILYANWSVESECKLDAVSANNVGIAQYEPFTAKEQNIKVNRHIDERKHPSVILKNAVHLANLAARYDSIVLGIAALNIGYPNIDTIAKNPKIKKAVEQGDERKVYETLAYLLPKMRHEHLTKIFGAAYIIENKYEEISVAPQIPFSKQVKVLRAEKVQTLEEIARQYGISKTQVKTNNPHILSSIIKPETEVFIAKGGHFN